MNDKRAMLRHFLAALAYRTQKALRDAPPGFELYRAGTKSRTPIEILRHMDSVIGYAATFFTGGNYKAPELASFQETISHFHDKLQELSDLVIGGTKIQVISEEHLLQGPLSDAMTHAGQLAMLRRLAGSPVPPENFAFAEVDATNVSPDQPPPAKPDEEWPERP